MLKKFSVVFLSLIFAVNLSAQDLNIKDMSDKMPRDPAIKMGKLDNGLVYFIKKNAKPENRAHFRLVVHAGAIQEDDDQDGLAHFTEHMCFNGTKNYPENELVEYLQKTGVQFGADLNAGTTQDFTMYELPIPMDDPDLLKNSLQILEDWAHNVSFTEKDIDDERGVITSEWRQRNSWQTRLRYAHFPTIYHNSKYGKRTVIGDTTVIKNFEYDVIRRYYNEWYRPNIMAVVAVGDFDVDKIEKRIVKHFSRLENPEDAREWKVYPVPDHKETLVSINPDDETPMDVAFAYFKHDDYEEGTYEGYAENIKRNLYNMMFQQRVQELSQSPVPPFSQAFGAENAFAGNKRAFTLFAANMTGEGQIGHEAILGVAFRVKQYGFTQSELDRVKETYLNNLKSVQKQKNTIEHASFVNEYMRSFLNGEATPGIDYEVKFAEHMLPKISLEDVNSLSEEYFKKENTVITFSGMKAEGLDFPTEEDLLELFNKAYEKEYEPYMDEVVDAPLFDKDVTPGSIVGTKKNDKIDATMMELSNGAKVVVKTTDFKDNEVLFRAISPGGTSLASDDDFYSADEAATLVNLSGIADFTNTQLDKKLSGKQVSVNPNIGELSEGLNGQSTVDDMETLFKLINLYFTAPRKDSDAFESYYKKTSDYLKNRANNPDEIYRDSVRVTLADNPHRDQPPSMEMLKQVSLDKAYKFYTERFADAGDFTFVFVGDIDMEQFKPFVEKYIASLPSKGSDEKWKNTQVREPEKGTVNRFKAGENDKAHVRMVISDDFEWSQENRHRLYSVVSVIRNRFITDIREEKAGIYSPGVWQQVSKYPESEYAINIDFVCDPDRVDELVKASTDVLEDIRDNVSEDDFTKVQKAQIKSREKNIKKNSYWLSNIAYYMSNNDDVSTIPEWDKCIESLSADKIEDAAKKYIDTEDMIKIIMEPKTKM